MPLPVTRTEIEETLRVDATRHLQALLRLDTQSPPGNESRAAEYIAEVCRGEGIDDVQIVESAPGRGTVVARLRASHPSGRPFMLMGHTDVVTVEPEKWDRDPFGGELIDGWIWGRGALDMKSQVASSLAIFLMLKRRGLPLTRDVILTAFADEEAGGGFGAEWVWANHRELIDAEYAINEGAGNVSVVNGHTFFSCQAGEKGSTHLRLIARGKPGHASVPLEHTAMQKLGEALVKLHTWEPPTILTAPVKQQLRAMAAALGGEFAALTDEILATDSPPWELLAQLPFTEDEKLSLRAATRNTVVPTIVRGGKQINVIPSEVTLDLDTRVLPGQDPAAWRDQVQAVVGDDVEIAMVEPWSGTASDPASPLFDTIQAVMGELVPGATVVPQLLTGGTDAALIPAVKTYGFYPMPSVERNETYSPLIHGHNERIHVDDLAFATVALYEITRRFCGAGQ
jgi:acetylornithine deacetylase/succinyl-diaminopimelate desuccinylase-like protein